MSILSWFFGKKEKQERRASVSKNSSPQEVKWVKEPHPPGADDEHRKTERTERRELVYEVVRDAMLRAGVLAASYRFKVLSLDARGAQYVIMMDLSEHLAGDAARMAEVEALIAQSAKIKHDILVTAVYWRESQAVTSGLSRPPVAAPADQPGKVAASGSGRYEPLQLDEIAAFKKALATGAPAPKSGQVVKSRRRNPAPMEDFEATQIFEEQASPLSATQYGDLN